MPKRVLIADDEKNMRWVLSEALAAEGYEVIEAADGMELLDRLQEALASPFAMPDVIVTDVVMPRYSGLGVLQAIRRANWFTPVIVMSAIGDASITQKAKELGAVAFFKKPFELDELRLAVVNASIGGDRTRTIYLVE
jgi:DNA-binding NtrC family response regulator